MITYKNIQNAQKLLAPLARRYIKAANEMTGNHLDDLVSDPTIEIEGNNMFFWINIGNIGHYQFQFKKEPSRMIVSFVGVKTLGFNHGKADWVAF